MQAKPSTTLQRARIEVIEVGAYRLQLNVDLRRLVDKYVVIFGWDVQGVDELFSVPLIIESLRHAVDAIGRTFR